MSPTPIAGVHRSRAGFSWVEALCVLVLVVLFVVFAVRPRRERATDVPTESPPPPVPAGESAGPWTDAAEATRVTARRSATETAAPYDDDLPTNSVSVPAPVAGDGRAAQDASRTTATAEAGREASPASAARLSADLRRRLGPSVLEQLDRILGMEWGPETEALLIQLIASVGRSDPLAALELAAVCESRRARDQAVNAVLKEWSRSDPAAALEWFLQAARTNPALVSSSTGILFEQLAARHMDLAITRVWTLPTQGMKRTALDVLVTTLVREGDESMLFDLRAKLSPGRDRDLLDSAMIRSLTRYHAEDMADWAIGLPGADERRRAVGEVISNWGYDQPAAAAAWVTALPAGTDRERGLSRLAAVWGGQDPVAAANWLLTLHPPSPELDRAIGTFARVVARRDPAGALSWAQSITDPVERERVTRQVTGGGRSRGRAPGPDS